MNSPAELVAAPGPSAWQGKVAALAVALAASGCGADPTANISRPAVFRVSGDVVHHDLQPFAATVNGFGNSLIDNGSGFEPVVFRDRVTAIADAADRVVVDARQLTRYETLRDGFWAGADVRIYRVVGGRLDLLREDRVAAAGAHASGWWALVPEGKLLAPTTNRFQFRWDDWAKPDATSHFTVRAVDRSGRLSDPAPAVAVQSPAQPRQAPVQNPLDDMPPRPGTGRASVPPPVGLQARVDATGLMTIEWSRSGHPDLAGHLVYRSDDAPATHRGFFLDLERRVTDATAQIKAGDMVVLSRRIEAPSRTTMLSNRVWGAAGEFTRILPGLIEAFPDEHPGRRWQLLPHAPDTPVDEPGETFLRVRLDRGVREELKSWNHSGTDQSWYPVLERQTYRFEVWLRQQGPGRARFRLTGYHDGPPQPIDPVALDAGAGWKKYVGHFTPTVVQPGARPNAMVLELLGPGVFDVDNFRVFRADTPYLDLTARDLEIIRDSKVSTLRTHGTIKTGVRTYDMAQLTQPGGVINGTQRLNTLPQMLRNFRRAGVRPWLQVEYHMSPDEWRGLVEYLAAPYDPSVDTPQSKPWAYKRWRQGEARPWTDSFDRIYFELANETWNPLFRPWTFDAMRDQASGRLVSAGAVYGLFQEHVRSVMLSSPYWRAAGLDRRVAFVLGGWGGQAGFSRDAAVASPGSDFLTFADYNGGWDADEGPPKANAEGYFNVLTHVVQSTIPGAERESAALRALSAGRVRPLLAGTYEAGPGYALDGLNGARLSEDDERQQERVMKSLAAGTATLDAFLSRAYRGYALQNFFTLDAGSHWKSHAPWYRGGQAYPSWKAIALFNQEGTGDLLRTETLSVPTAALRGFRRRADIAAAPLVAIYATRNGNRLNCFVVSRKVPGHPVAGDDGYAAVSVELPFRAARRVTLFRMTGAPFDHNLLTDNVAIDRTELSADSIGNRLVVGADTGADARGLPPASVFLYVFEGVGDHLPSTSLSPNPEKERR